MTIKDIAKACGVSVSTVSRVLNNRPDVSEDVRRRVLGVVEDKGYIPNNSARDLVRSRSDSIGVIVRGTGNLFFAEMLKTVSREIERSGYTMVLHFILKEEDYASVSIDDYMTAYRAVEMLIELGHRRIAAVVPSCSDRSVSELRFNGYRAALKDHGIEYDAALVAETGGCFDMKESYDGVCRMVDGGAEFTGLFMLSDTTAIAAMKALEDRGKRVPKDVSVIAIDGLSVSEYVSPTLTTLVQPAEEMGRESVRILLDMLDGKVKSRHLCAAASIRPGASVRRIDG